MTMTILELFPYLKKQGIKLQVVDGNLKINAPKNKLTPEIIGQLKEKKVEIIRFLQTHVEKQESFVSIAPAEKKEYYVLSSAQERMYILQHFDTGTTGYNMPQVVVLEGIVDREKLTLTFRKLIARHESLRTSLHVVDGEPVQVVHERVDFSIEYFDLTTKGHEDVIHHSKLLIQNSFIRPFDLSKAPLVRVGLVKIGADEHLLLMDMHHIISDGTSMAITTREFMALFAGETLDPPVIQYKDYSEWQQKDAGRKLAQQQETFWLDQFRGEAPVLDLPFDHLRPVSRDFAGDSILVRIDGDVTEELNNLAGSRDVTLFMLLLAIYNVLLSKLGGQEDIVVGTPVAGRNHDDLGQMVGMFVNTLALRNFPAGVKTFREFLAEVKRLVLNAFDNQAYQYEELVEKVQVNRDTGRNPLFDTMLILQNTDQPEITIQDLTLKPFPFERSAAKFDLSLMFVEGEDEKLLCNFEYSTRLFKEETIIRFTGYLQRVIRAILENPDIKIADIEIVSPEEKEQLLVTFNDTAWRYPKDKTIYRLFEEQAEKTGDRCSAISEEMRITYNELNQRANRVAHMLREKGVGPDTVVAIDILRSVEMIIGIFGILKAGGAYLPIDPLHPQDRIDYILKDSNAIQLLTKDDLAGAMNCAPTTPVHPITPDPGQLAYIIYTSGSTGKPKGVMVEHRSVINRLNWMQRFYPIGETDVILQKTPVTFDVSVWELFWWSFRGASLYLLGPGQEKDPGAIVEAIHLQNVTTLHFVPSMLTVFLDHLENGAGLERLKSIRQVFASGEALGTLHVKRFNRLLYNTNKTRLINLYGPTEATVDVSYYNCDMDEALLPDSIPIGKPIDNTRLVILDRHWNVQPVRVAGELCIAGDGLARGYLNRPELTGEKFVDLNRSYGAYRTYKTGDLAKWLPDGNIEFLGRIDHQVKIRGFRIELGEIENRLLENDYIKEAVVVSSAAQSGENYLCAYFAAERKLGIDELREFLSRQLPEYMIPAYFMQLEEMPLNPSGKTDRKRLPRPEISLDSVYTAPGSNEEKVLAAIWEDILEPDRIGIDDNFFYLGGHSLLAVRLVSKIHKALNVNLTLGKIFENPTIRKLALFIKNNTAKENYISITPVERQDYYPVSSAQKRLYVLQKMDEQGKGYNLPFTVILEGNADKTVIEKAFMALVHRHESLRTSFHMVNGEPVQVVHEAVDFSIETIGPIGPIGPIDSIISGFIRPFDLSHAPLLRVGVAVIEDAKHLLMVDMHHIVSDGTSLGVLVREFMELYGGKSLPAAGIRYKDYAAWQHRAQGSRELKRQEAFWLNEFAGEIPVLDIPFDYVRPAVQEFAGNVFAFEVDKEETRALNALGAEEGATLFMVLLAVFNVLLSKLSAQEDIVVGAPVAGRGHDDLQEIVGMFVNTLALRNFPGADKVFNVFLGEIKTRTLAAFENQAYQYESLVDQVAVTRDTGRNPLFDAVFVLQNVDIPELEIPGLKLKPCHYETRLSKFDITLTGVEHDNGLGFYFEYRTKLFKEETIKRFSRYLKQIVSSVLENPAKRIAGLDMIPEEEKQLLLVEFNDTEADYPQDKTIHRLIEEQAATFGDRFSVVSDQYQLTYGELDGKANALAVGLQERGVGPGSIAAIMMEQSIEMIAGMLAILKSGAAFLPIDPEYPQDRIDYMLNDSNAALCLDDETYRSYRSNRSYSPIENTVAPGSLAYIIYTSGSTGRPKGVMVEHRSLVNLCSWHNEFYRVSETDHATKYAGIAFDATIWEIFPYLVKGASINIIPAGIKLDVRLLNDYYEKHDITIGFLPTQVCEQFMEYDNRSLRVLLAGGDKLKSFEPRRYRLYNNYGPTENTVVSTACRVQEKGANIPIGKPVANTQIYILDPSSLLPRPLGVAGELCISGAGLARGYLNRQELTAERFVDFYGSHRSYRTYKTGDLARWLPDGNIEFLGRIDHQVKIRGYRIELGEIESRLMEHGEIKETVVVSLAAASGDNYLCAYFTSGKELEAAQLKEYLARQLPGYMIPAYFMQLEEIPLNSSGKADRKKLPKPETVSGSTYAEPETHEEKIIAAIWQEILEQEHIGIDDDFFERGGHSLKATALVSRMHKELDVEIPLADVFRHRTIRQLANRIETQKGRTPRYATITPAERQQYYPLSSTQKRQYILQKMDINSTAYNMPMAVPLQGDINLERLEAAFKQLIHRHESLRTSFHMTGDDPVQKIHETVDFSIENIGPMGLIGPINEAIAGFIRPFDLAQAPLLRVGVLDTDDGNLLLVDVHHIITDGTSQGVLTGEFMALYREEIESLPPLTLQYKDFAVWQNSRVYREMVKRQEEYWLTVFPDELPVLDLPADHPRPPVQRFDGDNIQFALNEQETKQLNQLALESGTTLYMVLLSIFSLLLSKLSGDEDIIVGTPVAGRRHADLTHIIGMFLNTLAIRSFPAGEKDFASFLQEVKAQTLTAYENQDYPFEDLVDKLGVQRDTARNPIFDVMFNLLNQEEYSGDASGLVEDRETAEMKTYAKFDLELRAMEQKGKLYFALEYSTSLFKESTIRRFTEYFKKITAAVLANPEIKLEKIDIIPDAVKKEKLAYFNEDLVDPSVTLTLQEKLSRSFRDNRSRTAAEMGDRTISYGELDKRSDFIADCILSHDIGKETPIGIFCEDRVDIIVIIIGILKAGCAFSPLETTFPASRISTMIRTTAMPLVFTDNASEEKLAEENIETVTVSDSFFREYELQFKGKEIEFNGEDIIYIYFTSGSTGTPKAIAGKNHALLQFVQWQIETFGITPSFRFSQLTAVGFDVYLRDVFTALCAGAAICIPEDRTVMLERNRFIQWLDRGSVNLIHCVPSVFRVFNSPDLTAENFKGLRYILFAGEPTIPYELKCWYDTFGERIQLVNVYGATEVTLFKICHFISPGDADRERLPIGGPTLGGRFILLDKGMNVCDRGIVGEVYVRTPYLAAGYLNDPELTAERFIANPFGGDETDLIYKMGDLGREAADGHYELLGRMDGQVKLRGIRIELGDIESALLKHDAVEKAVVLLKKDDTGEKYLCAYIVPRQPDHQPQPDAEEFRSYMKRLFPDYMVPAFFISVDRIPLTPNGKIDRKALPRPEFKAGDTYVAPRTKTEETLADIWAKVLSIETDAIGIDDNFFHLGGHSLRATVAITRIQKELAVEVPLVEFFTQPTIRGLARLIGIAGESKHAAIEPAEKTDYYPLSSVQKRLYFIQQLDPSASGYNVTQVVELMGELDAGKVEQVFRQLVHRHESLRTSFHMIGDEPVQIVHDFIDFSIEYTSLEPGAEGLEKKETETLGLQSFIRPFDLSRAPLLRAALVRMDNTRHVLAVDMHHIITDGTSVGIFFREFSRLYSGETLPGLKLHYKDYAVWLGRGEQLERLRSQERFWEEKFLNDGEIPVLNLPIDHPRPAVRDFNGDFVFFNVEGNEAKALNALALERGATPFMVLLSIYNIFLAKICLQEDVVVGIPTAGRRHADLEPVIGMFINTLPLRNKPTGEKSLGEFLEEVNIGTVNAFANQDFHFEELVEKTGGRRDPSRNPLFDTMFVLQNMETSTISNPGLDIRPASYERDTAKFDLTLLCSQGEDTFVFTLEYAKKLFKEETVQRFSRYLKQIIADVTANRDKKIAQISLLPEEEKQQLLFGFNDTAEEFPIGGTIYELFEKQVDAIPDQPALEFKEKIVTFRHFDERANQLANYLRMEKGLSTGDRVLVSMERSIRLIIALMGVMKAGGAYVPLDPHLPAERLRIVLSDASIGIVISQRQFSGKFSQLQGTCEDFHTLLCMDDPQNGLDESPVERPGIAGADNSAYVMYTSGSSGVPKGVLVEHRTIVNTLIWRRNFYDYSPGDVSLQIPPYFFDSSVTDIFTPLLGGARLVLVSEDQRVNLPMLKNVLPAKKVTHFIAVPAFYNVMIEEIAESLSGVKKICCAGEHFPDELIRKHFEKLPHVGIVNEYGPTENSVNTTAYELKPGSPKALIGSPISNVQVTVRDRYMNLCPIGVGGEMCLSGASLACGYLNRPELTAEKFVDLNRSYRSNMSYNKTYRTGDLARWLPDGNLEFLGRLDNQVKIRGIRVEVEEIENHLMKRDDIKEAVVLAREDSLHGGDRYLCAYIVSANGKLDNNLKRYLGDRLPEYMIPSHIMQIDAIPFTPTGKIDRNAFPMPEVVVEDYTAPRNETEKTLAGIWAAVLGRDLVGTNDNFFSIGGDSIKSIQIMSRLNNAGYKIQLKDIFQFPTIAELSPHVKRSQRIADQSAVTGPVPLTPIQQVFFNASAADPHHYNQAVMLYSAEGFDKEIIQKVFVKLQEHHDALRMTYKTDAKSGAVLQVNQDVGLPVSLREFGSGTDLTEKVNEIQTSIDLETGPLMKLGLFHLEDGDRLLIVVHHLVIDGISWRILFEDIESLYRQIQNGKDVELPLKTDSFKLWGETLREYAGHKSLLKEREYWSQLETEPLPEIPKDLDGRENLVKDTRGISVTLDEAETDLLLNNVNQWFNTEINDILITALGLAVRDTFGFDRVAVVLEGHGREELHKEIDISRTVGWFTTEYPVVLDMSYADDSGRQIKEIKETLRRVPNKGIGYGVLKYLADVNMGLKFKPQIVFNYLGQFDADVRDTSAFEMAGESTGNSQSSRNSRPYELEFNGMVAGNRLSMTLSYNGTHFKEETVNALSDHFRHELDKLISFCVSRETVERTPGDFIYKDLTIDRLQQLQQDYPDVDDIYPLSPMQEGMLFHALVDEGSDSYFEQTAYRLQGELDIEVVEKSLDQLFQRHDILRTAFVHKDVPRPLQLVLKNRSVDFYYEDIGHIGGSEEKEAFCREFKAADKKRFFDLSTGILGRVSILQLDASTYEFVWSFHHILMDGWCIGILNSEFFEIYNGRLQGKSPVLPGVKPYRTYIQWLEKLDRDESGRYWTNYLDDFEEQTGIPKTKRNQTTYRNEEISFGLDTVETERLNNLASRHHVTLNILTQTIWAILLGKYNRKEDVVFGSVVSGRPFDLEGVESMVGLFINTVPVRIGFNEGMKFNKLMQKVQQDYLAGEPYHYHTLADIQSNSPLKQNLLDHLLVFENYPVAEQIEASGNQDESGEKDRPSLKLTGVHTFEQTNYDFNIIIGGSLRLAFSFRYNANAIGHDHVKQLAHHFRLLLDQVMDNGEIVISALTLLSEEEKHRLLVEFNDTEAQYPGDKTIHRIFEDQAEKFSNRCSVVSGQTHITYGELDRKANALAAGLQEKGVGPDTIVGIMSVRSPEMIIGILGILKAGGCYMPVDPDYPQDRIDYMLKDSNAKILLTADDLAGAMNCAPTTPVHPITPDPGQLAYIIYTSGTTGKPKGTLIQHNNVVRLMVNDKFQFEVSHEDVWSVFHSFCFDFSVWEMYGALLYGGKMVIVSWHATRDTGLFLDILQKEKVTMLSQTPSAFYNLSDLATEGFQPSGLNIRYVVFGGEALKPARLDNWRTMYPKTRLINMYGITETTVHVTFREITESEIHEDSGTIGKPIPTLTTYVIDSNCHLLPVGIPGECCVGGEGVARGYLNRPELTSEKFIQSPFKPGERLYRSGDLVKMTANGEMHYMGRIDQQVKIRGFRIELGEIESQLMKHPTVNESVVIARKDRDRQYLCAYFTAHETGLDSDTDLDHAESLKLKEHLGEMLPDYMVPACFIKLDHIPLNTNGKVHRSKLPEPKDLDFQSGGIYQAPVTKTQRAIAGVWKEVLGREKIGILDDFFELGGNSLDLVSVSNKLRAALKQEIPMVTLFNHPTISELENYLSNAKLPGANIEVPINFVLLNGSPEAERNIFIVHEILGDVGAYMAFSQHLGTRFNCWGVEADKLRNYVPRNETVEEISAKYIAQMRQIQPNGPYALATWSWGGHIGLEMALQLERMGEKIDLLAFFDTLGPDCARVKPEPEFTLSTEKDFLRPFFTATGCEGELEKINDVEQLWIRAVDVLTGDPGLVEHLRQLLIINALALPDYDDLTGEELIQYLNLNRTHANASSRYIPSGKLDTTPRYFWANQNNERVESWQDHCENPMIYHEITGDHHSIFRNNEHIKDFAGVFKKTLEQL